MVIIYCWLAKTEGSINEKNVRKNFFYRALAVLLYRMACSFVRMRIKDLAKNHLTRINPQMYR